MSIESEPPDFAPLQHEAEHVRPVSKGQVMLYLAILFAAAFLLLLMSYFMQQRQSEEAIHSLKQTMNTMTNDMRSIEEFQAENRALTEALEVYKEEQVILTEQVAQLSAQSISTETVHQRVETQLAALGLLNQLRALYNQGKYSDGRALLETVPNDLEATLQSIRDGLSQEARDIYDPLAAYRTLVEWLTK